MPKKTLKLNAYPSQGGLRTSINAGLISPQELSDTDNIIFTNDYTRKKRPGIETYNKTWEPFVLGESTMGIDRLGEPIGVVGNVQGIFDFTTNALGSPKQTVVMVANGKVFSDQGNGHFADITGDAAFSSSDIVSFDSFAAALIIGFSSSAPYKYLQSGNIAPLGGSPPTAAFYRTYLGTGWLSGNPTYPNRVYQSFPGTPEIWSGTGTNSFDLEDTDTLGITALFPPFFGSLYIGKRKSIHRIVYSGGAFAREEVVRGVGCVAHNSVVALENDVIFASERGIHSLVATDKHGDVEGTFLSAPIHDIYNNELDYQRAREMKAIYAPELNSYLLLFPVRGSTRIDLLGYNLITSGWFRWKNFNMRGITRFLDPQTSKYITMVVNEDNDIGFFNENRYSDFETTAINAEFKTGIIYPQQTPALGSAFKRLTVFSKPKGEYNFTVKYKVDNFDEQTLTFSQSSDNATALGTNFILGQSKLGGNLTFKRQTKALTGIGSGIQLTFQNNNINEDLEIYGFTIEFEQSEDSDDTLTI